ncbi:MAG: hypothetical protein ACRC4M_04955 [Mycoplasma sp.]
MENDIPLTNAEIIISKHPNIFTQNYMLDCSGDFENFVITQPIDIIRTFNNLSTKNDFLKMPFQFFINLDPSLLILDLKTFILMPFHTIGETFFNLDEELDFLHFNSPLYQLCKFKGSSMEAPGLVETLLNMRSYFWNYISDSYKIKIEEGFTLDEMFKIYEEIPTFWKDLKRVDKKLYFAFLAAVEDFYSWLLKPIYIKF